MLEIIYRIYEVATEDSQPKVDEADFGLFDSISSTRNIELAMDCMVVESRDQFKQIIRDSYGADIKFRYSRSMKPGTVYCIIIGEHCYTVEKYFNRIETTCACCGAKIVTYYGRPITISRYEIRDLLFNIQEYEKYHFCSNHCKDVFLQQERLKLKKDGHEVGETEVFIRKDMFTKSVAGYIYKITKKSTGEFYVGQTMYAPVFRWGEHLTTKRFPIEDIVDYQFEVLEIVPLGESILEHETKWIQLMYMQNPDKSLNIAQTEKLRKQRQLFVPTNQ